MEKVLYYTIKIEGIDDEQIAIGKLDVAIKSLTKELSDLHAADVKNEQQIGKVNVQLANAKKQRSELTTELKKATQETIVATTSMVGMELALAKDIKAFKLLTDEQRASPMGLELQRRIAITDTELKKLDATIGRHQRNVGNYNTAGVAMSQVLREIPAFTFSAQTGILALSNNIPILVDEMKRISTSIDAVTGKKAGWKGAFAQMGANLLSFGGIMTIALGLFTIFSDEIIKFITGTEKAADKVKELKSEQEALNEAIRNFYNLQNFGKDALGNATTDFKILSEVLTILKTDIDDTTVSTSELNSALAASREQLANLKLEGTNIAGFGEMITDEDRARFNATRARILANIDLLQKAVDERTAKNAKKSAKDKKAVELKEQLSLQNEIYQALIDQMREGEEKKLEEERLRYKIALEETKKFYNDGVHTKAEVDRLLEEMEKVHQKNVDDIINKAREEREKERLKGLESVKKTLDDYDKYIEEKEKKSADEKLEKEKKDAADIKKVKQNLWGSLTEAENLYFKMQEDALDRHLRRQIRAIDQDAARQTDILKNRLDKGLISEAQYNADKAELDRQAEAKKQAAEKQAFEKQKKLAKAKIAVDTSVAIVKGYAEMNWVAATIQGVALTGLAALQLAAVDAQEFAEGGLVLDKNKNIPTKPNGDSVLTTLTPGEIVLNKQQQAMLGGNETFARIGVPNVPNIYPNAASGGSMSSVTKKDFQIMFNNLQNGINSKKVYQLESEAKRTRNTVENYETSNKW